MKCLALWSCSATLALVVSGAAADPPCAPSFGPGGCAPPAESAGQTELCFPAGCAPVTYTARGGFVLAESALPDGYPVIGWGGPCLDPACPEQAAQAYWDLWTNARRAARAQRAVAP